MARGSETETQIIIVIIIIIMFSIIMFINVTSAHVHTTYSGHVETTKYTNTEREREREREREKRWKKRDTRECLRGAKTPLRDYWIEVEYETPIGVVFWGREEPTKKIDFHTFALFVCLLVNVFAFSCVCFVLFFFAFRFANSQPATEGNVRVCGCVMEYSARQIRRPPIGQSDRGGRPISGAGGFDPPSPSRWLSTSSFSSIIVNIDIDMVVVLLLLLLLLRRRRFRFLFAWCVGRWIGSLIGWWRAHFCLSKSLGLTSMTDTDDGYILSRYFNDSLRKFCVDDDDDVDEKGATKEEQKRTTESK